MPELPEVETTRRGIEPWLAQQTLTGWQVRNPRLRWPVDIPAALKGQSIEAVRRRGKYLLICFTSGTLIIHLGMSGSLRILEPQTPLLVHDHVDLMLSNGKVLRFNDPRRFGCVLYQPGDAPDRHALLASLGPEPLGNEFSGAYLYHKSRNRKVAIKNFIMDAKIVVGVGNIYAAEALYLAGIRPATGAGRIPRFGYERIADGIRHVLRKALAEGGTTLRDYVGSDGQPGYFRQQLNVYGRQGKACRRCNTVLKLQILGQRSSVYCPSCQSSVKFTVETADI